MPEVQDILSVGFDYKKTQADADKVIAQMNRVAEAGDKFANIFSTIDVSGGFAASKKSATELADAIKGTARAADDYAKSGKAATEAAKQQTEASKQATEQSKQQTEASKQLTEQGKLQTESAKQQTETSKQSATAKLADAKASTETAKQNDIQTKTTITLTKEQERQAKIAQQKADQAATSSKKEQKAIDDLSNDYKQLSIAYNEAALKAKNLALQQGSNTPAAKAALAEANAIGAKLKEVDYATGAFQRNVGNYGGAIADSFKKAYGFIRTAANILPGVGISGIFLLGFDSIMKVVEALGFFDTATERAKEEQRKFNDIKREELDIEKQLQDTYKSRLNIDDATQKTNQLRENSLNQAKEENRSKSDLLVIEKQIADARALAANEQFNQKGGFSKEQEAREALLDANSKLIDSETELKRMLSEGSVSQFGKNITLDKDQEDAQKKKIAEARQNVEDQIKLYNEVKGINEENAAALAGQQQKGIEIATYNEAQRRKLILEGTRLEQDIRKDSNSRILSDQRSNLAQRLAAIKDNVSAQKLIIQAEKNDVLNNPSTSDVDKTIASRKAFADTLKATRDGQKQIFDTRLDFFNRSLKASKETQDIELQQTSKFNEDLYNNTYETLEKRLNAQLSFTDRQKELIEADYNYQKTLLDQKATTDEEYKLLDANKNAKLVQLAFDSQKKITEIYKSAAQEQQSVEEKFLQFLQQSNLNDLDNAERYNKDIQALNKSLQTKQISIQAYEAKRTALEERYDSERLQSAIEKQESLIAEKKRTGESTVADEIRLNELVASKDIKNINLRIEARKKLYDLEKQLASEVINLISVLGTAGYERQKNELAELENTRQKNYENEVQRIKDSTIGDDKKAEQLKILDASRAAQKEQYDRDQKELDIKKAKFEKLVAIANIVAATAAAEVEALAYLSNPLTAPFYPGIAGTIAAIGAVQLAAVIATPIPKYAQGTKDHPGGWAEIGEGQHKELVEMPGGQSFIADKPMFAELPKHTKVTPLTSNEINNLMYRAMARQTAETIALSTNGKSDKSEMLLMELVKETRKNNKGRQRVDLTLRHNPEWDIYKRKYYS